MLGARRVAGPVAAALPRDDRRAGGHGGGRGATHPDSGGLTRMTINGPVLVTGGAGFIGSELVRQLVARGMDVLVFDNLVNGRRENLDGVSTSRCALIEAE